MASSPTPPLLHHRDAEPPADCFSRRGLPRRFGRYHLLRQLARGGMGEVFLASTTGVEGAERPLVLKVIRREYAKDPNFLARFLDEARVQAQLHHSGVAQVLEAATHEPTGDPYVVIEHIEGRSLGNIRHRLADVGGRISWEDAVAISTLVMDALAYIHERCAATGQPLQIVHRDLSPHNVMVSYGGEVKIIDFGTARGENRRCHTVAGVVFAKPGYVAPEVANGDPGDARVDLYAAGVMLWELCAGRRFLQEDAADHMAAVARNQLTPPPIAALIGAPAELDEVIAKLTAFDRQQRYPSARIAAARLGRLLRAAAALPNGERSVRARVAQLMYNLYPSEPGRSRREFARLVQVARHKLLSVADGAPEPAESATAAEPADETPAGLLPGTRYRPRRQLGQGSSSVVYEAEHVDLGTKVAVKILAAEHTCSRDFAARFRREARSLSRLRHKGVVWVRDFGQAADGRLFCVMELLEGRTLRASLESAESFDWRRALDITQQACEAADAAHRSGVVHRDLKPENLFLTDDGTVKLIDFGLAKTADEVPDQAEAGDSVAPQGGKTLGSMTIFGTPEYMAPEQVAGGKVDGRADLYSLGCVLYEMLTGQLPFSADSAVAILDAKLRGCPEPARERAPGRHIPKAVDRIVMQALARHPSRRFQSAAEMAEAIAAALAEPARRRARRRAVGSSVLAAAMAVGVLLLSQQAGPLLDHLSLPRQLGWLTSQISSSRTQRDAGAASRKADGPARSSDPQPADDAVNAPPPEQDREPAAVPPLRGRPDHRARPGHAVTSAVVLSTDQ